MTRPTGRFRWHTRGRRAVAWIVTWLALAVVGCTDEARLDTDPTFEPAGTAGKLAAQRSASWRSKATPTSGAAHLAWAQRAASAPYAFALVDGQLNARIAPQWLEGRLSNGRLVLAPSSPAANWTLEVSWTHIGRGADRQTVPPPRDAAELSSVRATYRRSDGSQEWFVAGSRGIEQGFELTRRPRGEDGEVVLELTIDGGLAPQMTGDGRAVELVDDRGRTALRYSELWAVDDTGRELRAWLSAEGDVIGLHVDDRAAVYPLHIDPLWWTEQTKLDPSNPAQSDFFGRAVAIDGDTALSAAIGKAPYGGVYVFQQDQGGTDAWGQVHVLTAGDATADIGFGLSVAISGDIAVVGAPFDDDGAASAGAAYVFYRDQGGADQWGQVAKVVAEDPEANDSFGIAVAASGDTALVGAPNEDQGADNAGAVYVFQKDEGGTDHWGQVRKVTAGDPQANHSFGAAVALDGDTALVGARYDDDAATDAGAVYLFYRDQGGSDLWGQVRKVTGSNATGTDSYGGAVSLSGDVALVGAPGWDGDCDNCGTAYVLYRDQGGSDLWGQVRRLDPSAQAWNDQFGYAVAVDGDHAVVSSPNRNSAGTDGGMVFFFDRNHSSPDSWGQVTLDYGSDTNGFDHFGRAVAMSGRRAVIGAPNESLNGTNAGAAYVYAGRWTDGEPCQEDDACQSDHCVDGVCCDTPCGGGDPDDCQACSVAEGSATEGTCEVLADGAECSDGTFCNGPESCTSGVCGDSAGDPCASSIGDGDESCTEACDEATDACTAPEQDGTPCDDQLFCTGADSCQAGVCTSAGDPCPGPDDDDDCAESCDESSESCTGYDPDGSPCEAGTCNEGVCGTGGQGAGGAGGSSNTGGGYGDDNVGQGVDQGGCGCRLAPTRRPPRAALALLALALAWMFRRRG